MKDKVYTIAADIPNAGEMVTITLPVGTLKSMAMAYSQHYRGAIASGHDGAKQVEQELWKIVGDND